MGYLVDDEGLDSKEALRVAAWDFSGVCIEVEEDDSDDESVAVDPCPSYFMKERYFFCREVEEDEEGEDRAGADLQAMVVSQQHM